MQRQRRPAAAQQAEDDPAQIDELRLAQPRMHTLHEGLDFTMGE
jgi:hypothetical protein